MKKGFTLIELLVVIAIIGILSSIVLASLNTARTKAKVSAIKADLATMRLGAAILYEAAVSYANQCTAGATGNARAAFDHADSLNGTNSAVCNASATVWAAQVQDPNGTYWCVDHTGVINSVNCLLGAGTFTCPTAVC